jgi:hypothetical protein
MVWQIERKLAEDIARPIIFYSRDGTCRQPYVKGLTLMVNSIFNGWRMEDVWLDKSPIGVARIRCRFIVQIIYLRPGSEDDSREGFRMPARPPGMALPAPSSAIARSWHRTFGQIKSSYPLHHQPWGLREIWLRCLELGIDVVLDFGFWSREERDATREKIWPLSAQPRRSDVWRRISAYHPTRPRAQVAGVREPGPIFD